MYDSAITCDEFIEETETIPRSVNEESITCKKQNFYVLLVFLLIAIAFLAAASIYCYVIKYLAKQKHLLPFMTQITN